MSAHHISIKDVSSDEKSGDSVGPSRSARMSHRAQINLETDVHHHQAIHDEKREQDHSSKAGLMLPQTKSTTKPKWMDLNVNRGGTSKQWECRLENSGIASIFLQSPNPKRIETKNKPLVSDEELVSPKLNATPMDLLSLCNFSGSFPHHEDIKSSSFPCLTNESLDRLIFQNSYHGKQMGSISSSTSVFCSGKRFESLHDDKSRYDAADTGTSVSHSQPGLRTLLPDGIDSAQNKQGTSTHQKDAGYFEAHARPLQDNYMVSNSNYSLFEKKGIACRNRGDPSSMNFVEFGNLGNIHSSHFDTKHCNFHGYTSHFASEMKMESKVIGETSQRQFKQQKNAGVQISNDPAINNLHSVSHKEHGGKMKNFFGLLKIPGSDQETLLDIKDLKPQKRLLHRMPLCCHHDMEMQRMCTHLDSVEDIPGSLKKFSKTMHHLFVTMETDMNFSTASQSNKEYAVSPELKGKGLQKVLTLDSNLSQRGKQETMLQNVAKSSDSKGREDGNMTIACLENESSAETDSMPISFNQSNNSPRGITSSPMHEDFLAARSIRKSLQAMSQKIESGSRKEGDELLDLDELPADLCVDGIADKEPSSSRTESLDVENLLSNAEQPENSISSPCDITQYQEPSSRWVKRLRLSASDSHAFGTKSLKLADVSSSDKVNKLFSRFKCYNSTNSESSGKFPGYGLKQFNKTSIVLRNVDSSKLDHSQTHSWVKRWCLCEKANSKERLKPQVTCESEKLLLEKLQKKQFPSIAAMALMGKAVNSFRPCELQKKGTLVVWTTKGSKNVDTT